jgi:NADPH2:quinone reductase
MRAAFYETGGEIRVGEVETPEPGPGEVRVRVAVSGVNPTDWKARGGEVRFPFQVPDQDGAGVVDAVGEGVDPGRVGERVWVYFAAWRRRWGTAAEFTVVPAEQAVPLGEAPFELGASLGIPALTAHRCLFADGPLDGATVLVAGGAGAVGHAALELARWGGAATVIATVSSEEKAELARAAGAHHVVNYREPGAAGRIRAVAPGGVDRVVEVALKANLELDLAVGATHVATYAADLDESVAVPTRALLAPNVVLRFVLVYTMPRDALRRAVADVGEAVRAGALTTLPLHRFALARTADAHDAVRDGAVGKVLIEPDRGRP